MLLLEVISQHKVSMGANARRCIDEGEAAEFTIGRLETCHWVLPQDYVSRVQAVLRCVNNMYFLECKGSAPLAINDRSRPVERNRIVRLSPGDVILIDDIEIQTSEVEAGYVPPRPEVPQAAQPGLPIPGLDPNPADLNTGQDDIMDLIGGGSGVSRSPSGPAPNHPPMQQPHSVLDNLLDEPSGYQGGGAGAAGDDDRWWEDDSGAGMAPPRRAPAAPVRPSPPIAPGPSVR